MYIYKISHHVKKRFPFPLIWYEGQFSWVEWAVCKWRVTTDECSNATRFNASLLCAVLCRQKELSSAGVDSAVHHDTLVKKSEASLYIELRWQLHELNNTSRCGTICSVCVVVSKICMLTANNWRIASGQSDCCGWYFGEHCMCSANCYRCLWLSDDCWWQ